MEAARWAATGATVDLEDAQVTAGATAAAPAAAGRGGGGGGNPATAPVATEITDKEIARWDGGSLGH